MGRIDENKKCDDCKILAPYVFVYLAYFVTVRTE